MGKRGGKKVSTFCLKFLMQMTDKLSRAEEVVEAVVEQAIALDLTIESARPIFLATTKNSRPITMT